MDRIGAAAASLVFTIAYLNSLIINHQDLRCIASLSAILAGEVLRLCLLPFRSVHRKAVQVEAKLTLSLWVAHIVFCWAAMRGMPPQPVIDMYQKPWGRYKHLLTCAFSTTLTESLMWPHYHPALIFVLGEIHSFCRWLAFRQLVDGQLSLLMQMHVALACLPWLACYLASKPASPSTHEDAVTEHESGEGSGRKPYKSVARQRHRVHIKLPDPVQPMHLTRQAMSVLNDAIVDGFSKTGQDVSVLSTSVRRGCVLLNTEVIDMSPDHPQDHDQLEARVMQHVADAMPQALSMLAEQSGAADGQESGYMQQLIKEGMSSGTAYLQLGHQRAYLTVSESDGAWELSMHQPCFLDTPPDPPELGLVLVSPQPAAASSQTPQPAGSSSASARAAGAVTSLCSAGEVCWLLQVQLWCDGEAGRAGQWQVQGSDPHLYATPSASTPPAGDSGMCCLQLWALGGTGYLRTHVLSCVPGRKQQGQDTGCTIMEVLVCASRDQLLCHHHGGPPLVVQPVALQLWNGDYWLHTSQSLLCVQQVAQGRDLVQDSCSWWGASSVDTCACVEELHALTHSLWQHDAAREEVTGHQLLLRDMAYWLSAVQQAAHEQAWCVCTGANVASHLQLPQSHTSIVAFAEAGQAVLAYAQQARLIHTCSLISAQSQLVSALLPASQQLASTSWAVAAVQGCLRFAKRFQPALTGFSCPECERLYCSRASTYLFSLRACSSGMAIVTGVAAVVRQPAAMSLAISWLVLSWCLMHFILLCILSLGSQMASAHRVAAGLTCLVLVITITLPGWGFIDLLTSTRRISRFGVDVCGLLTAQLPNRLHLQSVVPQHYITAFSLVQAGIMYTLVNASGVVRPWWYRLVGGLLASFLVPMLMDKHVRALVMSANNQPGAKPRAQVKSLPSSIKAGSQRKDKQV